MSAILSADDLNDFISPGVACIKPVETLPAVAEQTSTDPNLEHEVFRDEGPTASANAGPAQISLTDCLACSGCVTSAEAVLVSLQSHAEVLRALDSGPSWSPESASASTTSAFTTSTTTPTATTTTNPDTRLFVASVSPQTRANLAAACGSGVTEQEAGYMLEHLLSGADGLRSGGAFKNGFTWVVDTNTAREATLVLGADEVLQATSTKTPKAKPLLTSSCPGWVCYAEKTHPHVLSYLSKVKSPQALMGTLLKTTLSRTLGIPVDRIFHVAVMPCFDKKLEASREELMDGAWGNGNGSDGKIRDVDCVITSKEVLMLAESRGIDFFSLPRTRPSTTSFAATLPDPVLGRFLFPSADHGSRRPTLAAGSSGGNLHFILQSVLAQNPGATLHTTRGRNIDVVEYSITGAADADETLGGKPIFKAARYYGFRNIQNLVRRLRPARPSRLPGGRPVGSARKGGASGAGAGLDFAYVEVMACPGGCTNGGGQIKVDDPAVVERRGADLGMSTAAGAKPGPLEQKAWLAEIDEAYFSGEEDSRRAVPNGANGHKTGLVNHAGDEVDGISPSYVRDTLAHWAKTTGIDLSKLVYTTYREVVSDVGKSSKKGNGSSVDVTEHVVQLSSKIGGGW
ncbi:cytosolic fe-s cluster assembly factor nar-1 [Ophiostoma piceae UAMH 11346]|uniref:Nuclear architecture-related protein 1 n=1 Tax=Ophiostoma piceae (strain UAMH 11346) TaxID=1262450 RepID=S3D4E2_OPHP1|nr:cytosolic fe-s cluster assembly factor nar-1 [Ophiostoma piceae UAMH 11346]